MQSDKFKSKKPADFFADNKLLDDFVKLAGNAAGSFIGLKKDWEERLKQQFETVISRMDLVTREEFEVVKAMAAKARKENEELAKRIAKLEKNGRKTRK